MNSQTSDPIQTNSAFLWVLLGTFVPLLIPLIAMQFTEDVNWTAGDFLVMAILLSVVGSLFVIISRRVRRNRRRVVAVALAFLFVYVWAELAVGIFTDLGS